YAACAGVVGTALFSVSADAATAILVPEFRDAGLLGARIVAGLAFNVAPAAANGLLFALAVVPAARASEALGFSGAATRAGSRR
ncbi:MAG TPA: hypothetical protein VI796_05180, partial [Candidatus Thermoplasmatota archaeon]|nr:hypothetical protein [Candidatus Thermoplasmatota archaeon]